MIVIRLLTVQILGIVSCIVHDPLLMNDHRGGLSFYNVPQSVSTSTCFASCLATPNRGKISLSLLLWWCILVCWPVSLFVNDHANLS